MAKEKPITNKISGEALPGNFPHKDDANNAPHKSRELGGNNRGHKAGKRPGGER